MVEDLPAGPPGHDRGVTSVTDLTTGLLTTGGGDSEELRAPHEQSRDAELTLPYFAETLENL